jgi:hypothetical protein
MEQRSLIEHLARHLSSASPDDWPTRAEDAATILAIIKEPDAAMRAVGDVQMWQTMIDAALAERWSVPHIASRDEESSGSDEEGEIALTSDAVGHDRSDWVHLHHGREKH